MEKGWKKDLLWANCTNEFLCLFQTDSLTLAVSNLLCLGGFMPKIQQ